MDINDAGTCSQWWEGEGQAFQCDMMPEMSRVCESVKIVVLLRSMGLASTKMRQLCKRMARHVKMSTSSR